MALRDDEKKKSLLRAPNAAAPAAGVLPAVAGWALGRPAVAAAPKPMFTAPDYTKPNPTNAPVMTAAVAKPAIGAVTAPTPPATASAAPAPRTPVQLDQASQAEVAARNPARPPVGQQQGAGAPSPVGGAAALSNPTRRAQMRPDGVAVVKMADGTNAYGANGRSVANAQGTMGSVNQQSFGTAAVPQAQASIARPGAVASTYGMGVNDPRLNDQIQRPTNPNAVTGSLRGADQMAEQYNSREDREAARTLAGNLDTDVFRASFAAGRGGRAGRQAQETIAALRGQQAAILGGQSQLSAGAVQGRAGRDNQFGIAEMGEQGEQRRAELDAMVTRDGQQVTREGKQLDYNASMIEKPTLRTDRDGNLLSVAGTAATNVVDAQGNPVREAQAAVAQPRDYGAEKQMEAYTDILNGMRDMNGQLPPDAAAQAAALLAQAPGAQQGGQAQAAKVTSKADLDKLPKGARYLAPDGQVYIKN